jgi:hypothetical protein
LAKFAEMEEFPHVFQFSSHAIREGKTFEKRGKWNETFFHNTNPIVLELGCGKGEYTVGLAQMYPDKNFIGIDIKGARIWKGAKDSYQSGLKNVAFLRTDIEMIAHFFAENEVSEVWITFPDPQTKKVTIKGDLDIKSTYDGKTLDKYIKLDIGFTLVVIGTSRSVSEVHISVDVEESLACRMVHTIVNIFLVIESITIHSVIERNTWRIGINGREYQATLPCDVRSITALIQNVINHRLIAGCVLVDVR